MRLRETYDTAGHGVELVDVGGGWQILDARRVHGGDRTRTACGASAPAVGCVARDARDHRLPSAHRPSRDRGDSRRRRGSVLKSLLERGLIDVVGRAEGVGRPLLYGTTPIFLEQFALRHLEELPRGDELAIALRSVTPPAAAEPAPTT